MMECNSAVSSDSEDIGSEDDTYYDEFNDNMYDERSPLIHPVLQADLVRLNEELSPDIAQTRSLHEIQEMDIAIPIATTFLEKTVSDAWGLVYQEPVIVRLSLDERMYLQMNNFEKIEVFQLSSSNSRILLQLRKIVEAFCREQLSKLDNDIVKDEVEKSAFGSESLDKDIAHLVSMGYDVESVRTALSETNGNKEKAVEKLMNNTITQTSTASEQSSNPKEYPDLKKGFLCQLYHYVQKRLRTLNDYCLLCDKPHDCTHQSMLKLSVCNDPLCIFSQETLGVLGGIVNIINSQPKVSHLLILLTKAAAFSNRRDTILSPYPSIVDPAATGHMAFHETKKNTSLFNSLLNQLPVLKPDPKLTESDLRRELDKKSNLCYPVLRWIINSNRSHIVQVPKEKQLDFVGTNLQFLLRNSPPVEDAKFRALRAKHGSVFAFHGSPLDNWHSIVREGLVVASGTKRQLHGAAYGNGIYISPRLTTSLGYCRTVVPIIATLGTTTTTNKEKQDDTPSKDTSQTEEFEFDGLPNFNPYGMSCVALCEVITNDKLKKHNANIWTCLSSDTICTRMFFLSKADGRVGSFRNQDVDVSDPKILSSIQSLVAELS